ncbi:hypothetical protein DX884_17420 [Vibrio fluvialis]|nr:hypothetical protein [Vibrio fluvialis]
MNAIILSIQMNNKSLLTDQTIQTIKIIKIQKDRCFIFLKKLSFLILKDLILYMGLCSPTN